MNALSRVCLSICAIVISASLNSTDAQVVQLPTMGGFSYSGSVLVPDQGSISLGGNSTTLSSSQQFGPMRTSRSLGSSYSSGNASVSAHVIDLDEIDRQIRGLPATQTKLANGRTVGSLGGTQLSKIQQSPVAAIYAIAKADEKLAGRRRTMKDFTPGDYMMLMSHRGLRSPLQSSIPVQP
jgi:hypothetical protein